MFISKILSQHGRDFTALIVCEHCATHSKLDTGYNDAYYRDHVLPAITCGTCASERLGPWPRGRGRCVMKRIPPNFTPWFSIDDDGQPTRPGWYEVLYLHELECDAGGTTMYWDGKDWSREKGLERAMYGNTFTHGERWRGLVEEMKQAPTLE